MISYYDIRAARTAMRALQNKPLRRRKLDIHFSIPKVYVCFIYIPFFFPFFHFFSLAVDVVFTILHAFTQPSHFLLHLHQDNPSDKDLNQGTLVVFNLDPSVSNEDLRQIFGAYGEVKEVIFFPLHKSLTLYA